MTEISESLLCLYSAEIDSNGDTYTIDVPKRELNLGQIEATDTVQVALLDSETETATASTDTASTTSTATRDDQPPVSEGDVLDVEIETLGDQGDGIAKIGPGYVIIVEGATLGDKPTVRITDAQANVAFADIVERSPR